MFMIVSIIILNLSTDWYCVRDPIIFGSSYIIHVSYDIQFEISTQIILELVKVLDIYDRSFCVLLSDDRSFKVRRKSSWINFSTYCTNCCYWRYSACRCEFVPQRDIALKNIINLVNYMKVSVKLLTYAAYCERILPRGISRVDMDVRRSTMGFW